MAWPWMLRCLSDLLGQMFDRAMYQLLLIPQALPGVHTERHAYSRPANSSAHAQGVMPPPVQDEREGLKRELQATQERLAAAEAAVAAAQSATHMTTDHQLAVLDRQLLAARSALSIARGCGDTDSVGAHCGSALEHWPCHHRMLCAPDH